MADQEPGPAEAPPGPPKKPWTYVAKTPAELEQLAWDIIGGRVYGSWDIPQGERWEICFMPLALLDQEVRAALIRADIVHIYEYLDKAGPRSVNGMPMFFSCTFLNRADAEALITKVEEIKAFKASRAPTPPPG